MTDQIDLTEIKSNVSQALLILAGQCDYASKKDEMGFNAFDAEFGHNLAGWITSGKVLTEGQFKAAWKMVYKYQRQLPFDIPKYQEPAPQASSNGKGKQYISFENGSIHIVFGGKPSPNDREMLNSLSFRRWNPNVKDMPWQTNPSEVLKVHELFGNRPTWNYTPEFLALLQKAESDPNFKISQPAGTGPKITVEDGKIRFYFGGPPAPAYRKLLDTFDRKWMPDVEGKPWQSPVSEIEKVAALFNDCQFTQDFKAELQKTQILRDMSRSATSDFEVPGMRTSLLPFQKAGVEFLELAGGRALLSDEMGLGKTAQALAYLQLHQELRPAVIVVPSSLKINWQREIKKFMTSIETVVILAGRKTDPEIIKDATMIIINYDILTAWEAELIKVSPQALIIDEAHKVKNPKAQRTKALKQLAKIAKAYIPMTGTPMRNRPIELFQQLTNISPTDWGNWWQYATTYCGWVRGYGMGSPSNLAELHERIKPYVIRRTKAEVMKELPPKIRTTIVLEFDEAERKLHDDFLREAAGASKYADHLAYIEKAKQAAARGKMAAALAWIDEFLSNGEKLVVFGNHREITTQIYEAFKEQAVLIIGGVSQKKRQQAVDDFQNNDNIRLFVGNMEAAGVGLTLTAASNVAIIEFPWTPDTIDQAIDRCHRIGQTDSVTAWHLAAEDTIEEDIIALLEGKAEIIHSIMDGSNTKQEFSILSELDAIIRARTATITDTIKEL